MAELDLPRGPRELFRAVLEPLARAFGGEQNMRFGGGTALAARWAHRRSIDVGLFVEPDRYRHFHWTTGGRFTLDLTARASVSRLAIGRDDTYVSFHGLDGHITINPGALTPEPRSPDTVRGTRLPLETTNEILGKKLVFRMAQRRTILSHHLYDIAWANRHDPAELHQAFRAARRTSLPTSLSPSRTTPKAVPNSPPYLIPRIPGSKSRPPLLSASSFTTTFVTARPASGARLVPFPDADPQPHMIDYDLVRAYYFDPPAPNPHRVPSDEELIARHERRLFDHCVLRGGDPVAEGLGPHGSMIGGPGKPPTVHHCRVERTTPLDPLPLSWWAYPRAQLRQTPLIIGSRVSLKAARCRGPARIPRPSAYASGARPNARSPREASPQPGC